MTNWENLLAADAEMDSQTTSTTVEDVMAEDSPIASVRMNVRQS